MREGSSHRQSRGPRSAVRRRALVGWPAVKILHVAPVFFPEGPGGIQVHVRDVARAQLTAGHQVTILAGSLEGRPEPLLEEQEALGLRVLRLYRDDLHHVHHARGYHVEASRLIAQAFEAERPDVVHVHSWIALSTDLVATAERLEIPTVVTLHDFLVSCPRAYRQDSGGAACLRKMGLEACVPCAPRFGFEDEALVEESIELFAQGLRTELQRARAVITLLPGIGKSLLELAGLQSLEFEAIPLGYAPHPDVPRAPARSGGPVRFATWGRLGAHKGTELAVRAFVQASEILPAGAAELHLFGELLPDSYRRSVLEAAAGANVIEHGAFEFADLAAAGVDAALFPSRCLETFGFVIDEARELGLPLVLTGLGAYGERAAGDSLVVPDGDQEGWARAIEQLAVDPELRARLAAGAPAPSPTSEVYTRRLAEVYERALAAPPRGPQTPAPDPERWIRLRERYDAGLNPNS